MRFRKVLDLDGERAAHTSAASASRSCRARRLEYLIQVFTEDERNRAARRAALLAGDRRREARGARVDPPERHLLRPGSLRSGDRGLRPAFCRSIPPPSVRPEYQLANRPRTTWRWTSSRRRDAYATLAETYAPELDLGHAAARSRDGRRRARDDREGPTRAGPSRCTRSGSATAREEYFRAGRRDLLNLSEALRRLARRAIGITFYLGEIPVLSPRDATPKRRRVHDGRPQEPQRVSSPRTPSTTLSVPSSACVRRRSRCTAAPNAPCAETENDKKFSLRHRAPRELLPGRSRPARDPVPSGQVLLRAPHLRPGRAPVRPAARSLPE